MSHLTAPVPPAVPAGFTRLANVYVPYFCGGGSGLVFPVSARSKSSGTPGQRAKLPRFSQLTAERKPIRVTCWGDSVTAGGDSTSEGTTYPAVLERELRHAHPGADICVTAVAVDGSNTSDWLHGSAPGCDWSRVVDSAPDVVTVEFVNDAGLEPDAWAENYAEIVRRVADLGADLILTTPHWVMSSWMELTDAGQDARPYVSFLADFASRHGLALADVSGRWGALRDAGLPYETLLNNGINHPDDRGHALAGEEIARCFQGETP